SELTYAKSETRRRRVLDFFFSSRRRHTRSKRDWSSDVCSSDLHLVAGQQPADQGFLAGAVDEQGVVGAAAARRQIDRVTAQQARSEERRVGKEGRIGWSMAHVEQIDIDEVLGLHAHRRVKTERI